MRTLVLVVAVNIAYLVWQLRRVLPEIREHNFEVIRDAATKSSDAGWVPLRVTWHGIVRHKPHMHLAHPDHPDEFTLRSP